MVKNEKAELAGEKEDEDLEQLSEQEEEIKLVPKKELDDLNDKYVRLAADFQNYKRRTENEKSDIVAFANERIVKDLLQVMDSFERALPPETEGQDDVFKNGIRLIYKQLEDALKNFGVEEIMSTEKGFDPKCHDAVLSEEVDGVEPGKILNVMQKGYTLNGRVIRAAMVKVSV